MNRVCEVLGTTYPLIQGAMARIADASLAGAVSAGGGLGIIAAGGAPAEWVQEQIRQVRQQTDRPFGVNIMLLADNVEELVDLLIEEKVPVITTGAGNPGKYIPRFKEAGIRVIPVVSNVTLARRVERAGADAVVAEGMEAGGHIGETTTMALVPQMADALEIPVIAAGGIADGRGLAAAYMLGAEGVQVGTRFLVAHECTVAPAYKDMVLKAKDSSTVATGQFTGHPVRVLKNKLARQMLELEKTQDLEEFERLGSGALSRAVIDGDVDYGSVMSGQIAGLVEREQPAAEIIRELFEEGARIYGERENRCQGQE